MSFIPCRNCKNKKGPKKAIGFYYEIINNQKLLVECNCHIQYTKKALFGIHAQKANIPETCYNYRPMDDYIGSKSRPNLEKVIQYVTNFELKFKTKNLYITGPNGTQKSTLGYWICSELIKNNYNVQFILMQDLIDKLLPNFENPESTEEEIERLLNLDMLVLDESFSADKTTIYKSGYQLPYLDSFLRKRMEILKKATVFISNKLPEEIKLNGFSESIQNLVIRNTQKVGAMLTFEDNFWVNNNKVEIEDIFK